MLSGEKETEERGRPIVVTDDVGTSELQFSFRRPIQIDWEGPGTLTPLVEEGDDQRERSQGHRPEV